MTIAKDQRADEHASEVTPDHHSIPVADEQQQNTELNALPASAEADMEPEADAMDLSASDANEPSADQREEMSALEELEALYGGSDQAETAGMDMPLDDDQNSADSLYGTSALEELEYLIADTGDRATDESDIDGIDEDLPVDKLSDGLTTLEELESMLNDSAEHVYDDTDALSERIDPAVDQPHDLNTSALNELKTFLDQVKHKRAEDGDEVCLDTDWEQTLLDQKPVLDELRPLLQSCIDHLGTAADDSADTVASAALYPGSEELKNLLENTLEQLYTLNHGSADTDCSDGSVLDDLSAMLEMVGITDMSAQPSAEASASDPDRVDQAMAGDYSSESDPSDQGENVALDTDALIAEMNELLQESGIDDVDDDVSYEGTDIDMDISDTTAMPEVDDGLLQRETEVPESESVDDSLLAADSETEDESISNLIEPDTADTPKHTITDIIAQSEDKQNEVEPTPAAVDALERLEAMANMSADSDDTEHGTPETRNDHDVVVQQQVPTQTEADQHDWDKGACERLDDDNVVIIRKNSSAWNDDTVDTEQPSPTKTGITPTKLAAGSLVAFVAIAAAVFWALTDSDNQRLEYPSATLADSAGAPMPEPTPTPQWQQAGSSSQTQAVQTAVESGQNDLVAEAAIEDAAVPASQYESATVDTATEPEAVENLSQPLQERPSQVAAKHELDAQDHIAALATMNSDYFGDEAVESGDLKSHSLPDSVDPMPGRLAASSMHEGANMPAQAIAPELADATAETVQRDHLTADNLTTEGRYVWFVHIASYYGEPPPEKELEYLDEADVPYEIRSVVIDGSTWYRVLVSNFTAYQDAKDYSETLKTSLRKSKIWISRRRIEPG